MWLKFAVENCLRLVPPKISKAEIDPKLTQEGLRKEDMKEKHSHSLSFFRFCKLYLFACWYLWVKQLYWTEIPNSMFENEKITENWVRNAKDIIHDQSSLLYFTVGCVYKTHIKKIQVKRNHTVRLIFFARTFGRETESAKPLLNLLDLLTVDNIYRLEVLEFSHSWHNGLLPEVFDNTFQYARNIHRYNTRYTDKQNFYKYKVKTNAGKQSVSYMAIDIWKDLPSSWKT